MIKYSSYLFKNILKKWTIWVTLAIAVLALVLIIYIQIDYYKKYSLKFVEQVNAFTRIIPFMFGISFVSLITVYVFKEPEEDGTELLIVSKPIRRWQVILGKFSIIIFWIIAFNIIIFIACISIVQTDTFSLSKERINFSLSMGIGGMVVSSIAGMIVIFISSYVGKIGSVAIGIATASLFPIISNIIVQVSKADATKPFNSASYLINEKQANEAIVNQADNYIQNEDASVDLNQLISIDRIHYQPLLQDEKQKANDFINGGWYKYFAYVDIWYQWSQFYEMFTDQKLLFRGDPAQWKLYNEKVSIGDDYAIEKTQSKKNLAIPVDIFTGSSLDLEEMITNLSQSIEGIKKVKFLTSPSIASSVSNKLPTYKDVYLLNINGIKGWNKYEGISIIDLFKDKKYSFEDRIRGIRYLSMNQSSVEKIQDISSFSNLSFQDYLSYKFMILATQAAKEIAKDPNSKTAQELRKRLELLKNLIIKRVESSTTISPEQKKTLQDLLEKLIQYIIDNAGVVSYDAPTNEYSYYSKDPVSNEFEFKKWIDTDTRAINHFPKKSFAYNEELKLLSSLEPAGISMDGEVKITTTYHKFLSKTIFTTIWSIIGGIFVFITIYRYFRRDFK